MVNKRKIRATFRRYAFSSTFEVVGAAPELAGSKLSLVPISDADVDRLDEFISEVQSAVGTETPVSVVGPFVGLS